MLTQPGRTGAARVAREEEARPRPLRARRPGSAWALITLVVVLNLLGVVMVLSASSVLSLRDYGSPWHFFIRDLLWTVVGGLGFLVALRVDRRRWRPLARVGMIAALGALVLVLAPGIGRSAGGASRWLGTSSFEFQPSELAKVVFILFAADVLDRRAGKRGWVYQMAPVLIVLGALCLLILLQPDMGTVMVFALIALAMLFTAGMPWKPLTGLVGVGVGGALLMSVVAPYRWQRIISFLHPFKNASDTGYQSVQGLLALANGHVAGDGIGSSVAAWGYLPNAQTDFIFSIIGEETGLLGSLAVVGLFLTLGMVGARVACRTRDRFGALLAAGITAWLVGQGLINIGAVVGLLPVTGVPLPFVSYGGSSLIFALFGAGLLTNVARGD